MDAGDSAGQPAGTPVHTGARNPDRPGGQPSETLLRTDGDSSGDSADWPADSPHPTGTRKPGDSGGASCSGGPAAAPAGAEPAGAASCDEGFLVSRPPGGNAGCHEGGIAPLPVAHEPSGPASGRPPAPQPSRASASQPGEAHGPGRASPPQPGQPPRPGQAPRPSLEPAPRPGQASRAAGLTLRGSVNLVLPLSTWLGWSSSPGEVAGFGPLDAADSQALAAALAREPATKWCVTVTDSNGRAVAHGCARAGPTRPTAKSAGPTEGPAPFEGPATREGRGPHQDRTPHKGFNPREGPSREGPGPRASVGERASPGLREGPRPRGAPGLSERPGLHEGPGLREGSRPCEGPGQREDSRPREGTWPRVGGSPHEGSGPAEDPGAAEGPGPPSPATVREWLGGVRLAWLETGECSHRRESPGYRPSPALAHLIQVRQVTCTAPGCRRPAVSCDFEHTIPYHQGGRSCECNGGPCCRRHHRAKQASGWRLDQPRPGTFVWTTPHGRIYLTEPEPYPV
jgi:hypothetical protein